MSATLKEFYNRSFYDKQQGGSLCAARAVMPLILQIYTPRSVIDVGCGVGTWLVACRELVPDIQLIGLDGDYNKDRLLIAPETFIGCDLESSLPSFPKKFDLAISLEVAEHLSRGRAQSFVKELGILSDVVLFSAAWPGQGGVNHINEQWHEYWVNLFVGEGFLPLDWIRPQIIHRFDVAFHYKTNILLFIRREMLLKTNFGNMCTDVNWRDIQWSYYSFALGRESINSWRLRLRLARYAISKHLPFVDKERYKRKYNALYHLLNGHRQEKIESSRD